MQTHDATTSQTPEIFLHDACYDDRWDAACDADNRHTQHDTGAEHLMLQQHAGRRN